jgi:hypothetical protein
MKLNPLYKKLMLVAVVLGPIYWLTATEDGQRRTDLVLLSLAGDPTLNLRIQGLGPEVTEAAFQQQFPDLKLSCEARETELGERLCVAHVSGFNGIPARYISLFYAAGRLNAVKLAYHGAYHAYLLRYLRRTLGAPSKDQASGATAAYRWSAGQGVVIVAASAPTGTDEEPALLWLSAAALSAARGGG